MARRRKLAELVALSDEAREEFVRACLAYAAVCLRNGKPLTQKQGGELAEVLDRLARGESLRAIVGAPKRSRGRPRARSQGGVAYVVHPFGPRDLMTTIAVETLRQRARTSKRIAYLAVVSKYARDAERCGLRMPLMTSIDRWIRRLSSADRELLFRVAEEAPEGRIDLSRVREQMRRGGRRGRS